MRVIAGAAKGRRLVAPRGRNVRPTSDRVKEALFARIQPRLAAARVLDLYAGSGALGIEALSRGAARALFVERSRPALTAIRRNLEVTGFEDRAEVMDADVLTVLRSLRDRFDLVLLDPPYDLAEDQLAVVLAAVATHLDIAGVVVLERATRAGATPWPADLRPDEPRRYGDTTLHLAERAHG